MKLNASDPAPSVRADVPTEDLPAASHPRRWDPRDAIPWLSSLAVHGCIAILGLTMAQVILSAPSRQISQVLVPEPPTQFDPHLPTSYEHQRQGDLSKIMERAQQEEVEAVTTGTSQDRGKSFDFSAAAGEPGGIDSSTPVFSPTGGGGEGGPGNGRDGLGGRGTGEGGEIARFGPKQIGTGGTGLFPPNRQARRIVYACDASGSMIAKFGVLKTELAKSIGKLETPQAFNVFFFQDAKTLSFESSGLALATSNNRRRASVFMADVATTGTTNPIPSLEAAFKQEPELIYLLTDGDFPDNEAVLARIRELNKSKEVRINTIAFTDDNDAEVQFLKLLETIANENNGHFRHVRLSDLE